MLSDTFSKALILNPDPSLQLRIFIIISHVSALMVVLFLVPIAWYFQVLLVGFILLSGFYYHRLYVEAKFKHSIITAKLNPDETWKIGTYGRTWHKVTLIDAYVSTFLIILIFKRKNSRRKLTLILLADSLDQERLRQLRVRLRLNKI